MLERSDMDIWADCQRQDNLRSLMLVSQILLFDFSKIRFE
jgi:hypothetical protein